MAARVISLARLGGNDYMKVLGTLANETIRGDELRTEQLTVHAKTTAVYLPSMSLCNARTNGLAGCRH